MSASDPPRPDRVSADASLAGRGIVLTRPEGLADGLAARIGESGGRALLFPAMRIEAPNDLDAVLALIDRLDAFDLAVFISPSAVREALKHVRTRRGEDPWPDSLAVAAIGRGTRRELERQGFGEVIAPAGGADSEALLAMPALQAVEGRQVIVFRGEGGRELLGDTLRARGAKLAYAECYRRARPDADGAALLAHWARGSVHAVVVSSSDGLANVCDMLGPPGRQWLRDTPVFVPHARVAEAARQQGIREVVVAGAGEAETHAALVAYFASGK